MLDVFDVLDELDASDVLEEHIICGILLESNCESIISVILWRNANENKVSP